MVQWCFVREDTGFNREYYEAYDKGSRKRGLLYCNQWDNGDKNPPTFYRCSLEGEPEYECIRPLEVPAVRMKGELADKNIQFVDQFARDWLTGTYDPDPNNPELEEHWWTGRIAGLHYEDDIHAQLIDGVWNVQLFYENNAESIKIGKYKLPNKK
jgi:hypothetical protein